MKTEIVAESFLETALKKYTITEADIAVLSEKCLALKVKSVVDKDGYKIVKQARSGVRGKRMEVEVKRKELKLESLNFGRGVDGRAKTLTGLLTPIEDYLSEQERIVDDETLRIENEKARLAKEIIEKAEAIKKKEEEDRQAKIKAEQKAENARLENIRKEQEEKERKLQKVQDKIDAEKKAMEADRIVLELEAQRKTDIAKAQKEAVEKAKVEADEKAKAAVEKERLKKEQEEKAEALRIALMPDNEKLVALADTIEAIEMPALTHEESYLILADVKIYLAKICKMLKKQ